MNDKKSAKVLISVNEEDIMELIRGQVKHVLRNDTVIAGLIEEEIEKAVAKRVDRALVSLPIKERTEPMLAAFVAKAINWKALTKVASVVILDHIAKLLGIEKRTPEQVQKDLEGEVAKIKLDEKGIDKFLTDMRVQGVNRPWMYYEQHSSISPLGMHNNE